MIAAALAALSMVPICFTSAAQPDPGAVIALSKFAIAPAAVIGCFRGRVGEWRAALAPCNAERYGPNAAAEFIRQPCQHASLQWPAGRLSDRIDRRLVIANAAALAAVHRSRSPLEQPALSFPRDAFLPLGAGAVVLWHAVFMADRAEPGKLAFKRRRFTVWAAGSSQT